MLACFGGLRELSGGGFAIELFALIDAGGGIAVVSESGEDGGIAQGIVDRDLGLSQQAINALRFWHEKVNAAVDARV